ncbi:MAG TPA: RNA methyltransferase, partial [Acidobacteria bacterium]|nr:RNA methyltransferase [Acidobacteriota bacterium]
VWAAAGGGRPLNAWHPEGVGLLLLGAEGPGLRPEILALADGRVTIPMERQMESLNVAVAAGILLQHLRSQ